MSNITFFGKKRENIIHLSSADVSGRVMCHSAEIVRWLALSSLAFDRKVFASLDAFKNLGHLLNYPYLFLSPPLEETVKYD